jgi:hypothetical protein
MARLEGRGFLTSLFDSLSKYHQLGLTSRHGASTKSFRISAGLEPSSFVVKIILCAYRANVEASVTHMPKESQLCW